jgi:hypothetical protein
MDNTFHNLDPAVLARLRRYYQEQEQRQIQRHAAILARQEFEQFIARKRRLARFEHLLEFWVNIDHTEIAKLKLQDKNYKNN